MLDPNCFTTLHNFNFSIHDKDGNALRIYPARSLTEHYSRTVYVETPATDSTPSSFTDQDQDQRHQRFDSGTSTDGQFSFRITPVTPIDFTRTLGYHFQTYFDGITDFASLNITANENSQGGSRDCITVKDIPSVAHQNGGHLPYAYQLASLRCKHYKLRFLPIKWTDEELWHSPGYFNPEDGANGVGTIRFVIQEIEGIKPSMHAGVAMNSRLNAQSCLGQKTVYEKALKGKTLTHTIGASEDYKLTIPTTTLKLKPHVLGSITFHYRSRSTLQAMGIIPYDEPLTVADDFDLIPKMEEFDPFGYFPSMPSMPFETRTTQLTIREPAPQTSRGWFSNISTMIIRTNPNRQREEEYRQLNEGIRNMQLEKKRQDSDGTSNVILATKQEVPIEEFDKQRRLERKRRRAKRIIAKQQMGQRANQIVDLTVD